MKDLKRAVLEANLALARSGLVTLSFGNVSGVDRAAGALVIKPSGVPYADLRADDMVVVALDDGRTLDGRLHPSTDTPTHRMLYLELPEIGGVVHTHSPYASAWAQAGRPIPCLGTTHADYFRGVVPVSRPLTAVEVGGEYEWQTGKVIIETLKDAGRSAQDSPAVLVNAHGPFAWSASPAAAVDTAIALEAVAALAYRTMVLNAAAAEVTPELLSRHFDRKHGASAYYGQPASATEKDE